MEGVPFKILKKNDKISYILSSIIVLENTVEERYVIEYAASVCNRRS